MSTDCFRRLLYAGMIVSTSAALGCGKNVSQQPADKAEKVVETLLDAWSRGEPPETFADPDHPIQGADPDWKAGLRLMSFLTVEAKQSQEMPDHVHCRVALSLQDANRRRWSKEVVYDVQLGEKNVVTRVSR
jgi:hypothetical protein